jgi:hypothetical protein
VAVRFAGEARDAIATALQAGVALDDLAEEIDYPGGAAAMDGPHVDREIADLRDNGPAFEQVTPAETQDGQQSWLEITQVMSDDHVIAVLHGTPDMVAGRAWPAPRTATRDAGDDEGVDDRQAAEVAALREHFAASRDSAAARLATAPDERGEEHIAAVDDDISAPREQGIQRGSGAPDAGMGS